MPDLAPSRAVCVTCRSIGKYYSYRSVVVCQCDQELRDLILDRVLSVTQINVSFAVVTGSLCTRVSLILAIDLWRGGARNVSTHLLSWTCVRAWPCAIETECLPDEETYSA